MYNVLDNLFWSVQGPGLISSDKKASPETSAINSDKEFH